jgi:hypothetical protein
MATRLRQDKRSVHPTQVAQMGTRRTHSALPMQPLQQEKHWPPDTRFHLLPVTHRLTTDLRRRTRWPMNLLQRTNLHWVTAA